MKSQAEKEAARAWAKKARDERRRRGICIDEPKRGPRHGRIYKGARCMMCWKKYKEPKK